MSELEKRIAQEVLHAETFNNPERQPNPDGPYPLCLIDRSKLPDRVCERCGGDPLQLRPCPAVPPSERWGEIEDGSFGGFRPSELLQNYHDWTATVKAKKGKLDPDAQQWLFAWDMWDIACSPMDDEKRRLYRYGHYLGWVDYEASKKSWFEYEENKKSQGKSEIRPDYYKHPSGIECRQITNSLNFNLGNAVKYLWRHQYKGNPIQDLEKAKQYLSFELERLKTDRAFAGTAPAIDPRRWTEGFSRLISQVLVIIWIVSFPEQQDPLLLAREDITLGLEMAHHKIGCEIERLQATSEPHQEG